MLRSKSKLRELLKRQKIYSKIFILITMACCAIIFFFWQFYYQQDVYLKVKILVEIADEDVE